MNNLSPSPSVPEKPSLRQRTTHGVVWLAAQALLTRGVTLIQQLVLAWLLAKSDFGLIGLAYSVTLFVNLISNPGIDTVLVQRVRRYTHWATPAFWLGMVMGLVGSMAMIVLAYAAAWAYRQPELVGLILVLAMAPPLQALQIVPRAQLQMELRFRSVVLLNATTSTLTAALTILCAYLDFGAYSFVLPVPIVSLLVAVMCWRLAKPPIQPRLAFSRWRYLIGNGAIVGGSRLLHTFINHADYMLLGLAGFNESLIGVYVFAFNVAVQPLRLLAANVPHVLFPSLSRLSLDPARQVGAAIRAMRLLTLVTVPFFTLQIILAEPLFRLLFPARWLDAVLPCQVLTFGLMMNASSWPANSLMLAQGRYKELLQLTFAAALAFVAVLTVAISIERSIIAVAWGIVCGHLIYSPLMHWVATRQYASGHSYLSETFKPVAASALAAAICWHLPQFSNRSVVGDALAILFGTALFAAIYLVTIWLIWRSAFSDLVAQLTSIPIFRSRRRPADPLEFAGRQA